MWARGGRFLRSIVIAVPFLLIAVMSPVVAHLASAGAASTPAPVADLGAIPTSGTAPLGVTFDGSMSADPNGTMASWSLSFGDGTADATGTGGPPSPTATHVYSAPGTYTAKLTVTGSDGQTGVSTSTVVVNKAAPSSMARLSAVPISDATGIHKIKHVIMIMQENRSFDSYFGTYPGADGIPMSGGVPTVCEPDPRMGTCVKPYHDTSEVNLGGPHGSTDFAADYDNGKMDGFIKRAEQDQPAACGPGQSCVPPGANGPTDVMGYHTAAEIPNYWTYAKDFVLQDHMFESNEGSSLPSHLGMVSLWSATCSKPTDPMSCTSALDGPSLKREKTYPWTDLTWLLHSHGVSWKYYVGTGSKPDCETDAASCEATSLSPAKPGLWNPLPKFSDVSGDGQLGNIVSTAQFYPAARNGTLPSVSWVVPSGAVSEHPPSRVDEGQAYVTGLINSVMEGPDWASTAIFLSWDDWGGFYDGVTPPSVDSIGYGFRVPSIIISPYAKAGYIDHQVYSFDAYAKFIEDDFLGGARLDPATDGRPDSRPNVRENKPELGNLQSAFDFSQAPLAPVILNSGPPWGPTGGPTRSPVLTTSGTAPLTVSFDASRSASPGGSISSWKLSFGDGTPDASGTGAPGSPTVQHTYSAPGTYTATLTVTNSAGQTGTATITLTVHPALPVPALTASPPGTTAPAGITFDGSASAAPGSSITSWDLSFGDGTPDATGKGTPPSPTAVHTYQQAGIYNASLTVTDQYGDSATAPFSVMVLAPLTFSPSTVPPGGTVVVSAKGFEPGEQVTLKLDGQPWATVTAKADGSFASKPILIPASTNTGEHVISADGAQSGIQGQGHLLVYTNWAEFRFSQDGKGMNPYESSISPSNVGGLGQTWVGSTAKPVTATPILYDGLVYLASTDGRVRQLDASTYTRYKTWNLGAAIDSTPAAENDVIYAGAENGYLYALDASCIGGHSDGQCPPSWKLSLGSAIESSPTVVGTSLYVGADNGKLYDVDTSTRKLAWSVSTGGSVQSSPAVYNGTVFAGSGDGKLYGIDTATGKVLFTGATGGAVTSSSVVVNGVAYVGSADGKLYAFSATCRGTCSPLWTVATGGPILSSPAVAGGVVYVGSNDGKLYAIDIATRSVAWTMATGGAVRSSPAVANGVAYVGSSDGNLYAAGAAGCGSATCPPLWKGATGGPIVSSPVISDGSVYVGSNDDNMHVFSLPTK